MRKTRMSLLGLIVPTLLVGSGIAQDAKAEIRFDATLRTPNVRVRIGNLPPSHYRSYKGGYLPVRRQMHYRITKHDRAVARRLARYTGVPAGELIQLKRYGYSWLEIGRWLYLPRPVVRAAMNQRSWKRFLVMERRHARYGPYRSKVHRIIYFDAGG
jgi:hypothetical protein